MLEPWAAGRAAELVTAESIAALRAELESRPPVPQVSHYEDYRAFSQHDGRFHGLIHDLVGNEFVSAVLQRQKAHLHLFRLAYAGKSGAEAVGEHQRVFEASVAATETAPLPP